MGFEPTRSRRVVGSNPIWDSDFFLVYVSPRNYTQYHVVVSPLEVNTIVKIRELKGVSRRDGSARTASEITTNLTKPKGVIIGKMASWV